MQVEGILSLAAAPLVFFALPNNMETAWFLTAKQKQHIAVRMERNKIHYDPAEPFRWSEVLRGLKDWKVSCLDLLVPWARG